MHITDKTEDWDFRHHKPIITNVPQSDDTPESGKDRITPRQDRIQVGDLVVKTCGDYQFMGDVIAHVVKRSGETRYVVEDSRGLLLIMSPHQLTVVKPHNP